MYNKPPKAYISINVSRGISLKKIQNKIPSIIWIIALSVLGFVIGTLTIALRQENWLIHEGILNQEFICNIESISIDKRALFFLCLGRRIRAFFLLLLLSFSSVNIFMNCVFFLINGFYTGSILELFAIRYGMQGIGMYFTMVFPQGICYALGFGILGCWCLNQEKIQGNVQNKKIGKLKNIRSGKVLIMSFFMILIGIILESYINPKIFFFFI